MNKAENEAGNKAVDSLINFETVKVFFTMIARSLFNLNGDSTYAKNWEFFVSKIDFLTSFKIRLIGLFNMAVFQ